MFSLSRVLYFNSMGSFPILFPLYIALEAPQVASTTFSCCIYVVSHGFPPFWARRARIAKKLPPTEIIGPRGLNAESASCPLGPLSFRDKWCFGVRSGVSQDVFYPVMITEITDGTLNSLAKEKISRPEYKSWGASVPPPPPLEHTKVWCFTREFWRERFTHFPPVFAMLIIIVYSYEYLYP